VKIYVGNLSYSVTQEALEEMFAKHGEVEEVYIPTDRDTGRPRGFAFVTMPNADEAKAAITATTGQELEGRRLNVNEARPKTDSGPGGGRDRGPRGR